MPRRVLVDRPVYSSYIWSPVRMVSQSVSNLGIFLDCRLVGCFMVHGQSVVISRLDLLTTFIDFSTVVVEMVIRLISRLGWVGSVSRSLFIGRQLASWLIGQSVQDYWSASWLVAICWGWWVDQFGNQPMFFSKASLGLLYQIKKGSPDLLLATQWAAVTIQVAEMSDPPQMNLLLRCNAIYMTKHRKYEY